MLTPEGYALARVELYNWGTFNQRIWTIEPARQTALLTGANGSGKSTLVDALLTLLVPNRRRNYNLASGDRRGERTEKSYVRGAYSRLSDSGMQYLRGDETYSVILAAFHSPGARPEWVTLAQVFYNGGANKFHVVAPLPLTIKAHFHSESMTQLRRQLRKLGADTFDQFNEYSAAFRKLFRLRSEKALDLFSQTTSIKEIGSLNQFIRDHMLEKTDAERQIQQLRDNFDDLTRSYDAIVKAERQQALLQPIIQEGVKYRQLSDQIEEARRCENAIPHYFMDRRLGLLADAIQQASVRRDELHTHSQQLQVERDRYDRQRLDLRMAIERDETGQLLRRLREEGERLAYEASEQKHRAAQYDLLAQKASLSGYSDVATFHANRQTAETEIVVLTEKLTASSRERDKRIIRFDRLRPEIQELEGEITALQHQRSQIPARSLQLREQIVAALGLDEGQLPFIGELIRVRDEASAWEGALERVLHSFALTILVADTHYKRLSQYVNKHNLNGRLVYRRIHERPTAVNAARLPANALYHKIEVKADTAFTDWLRAALARHYDYVCCDSLEDFRHQRRAITVTGQIKHDESRHEKDDRYDIHDRKGYVLGWDNRAKLEALQTRLDELTAQSRRLKGEIRRLEEDETTLRSQQDILKDLLRFDDFGALDWRTTEDTLRRNHEEQRRLEASSNRLHDLQAQLKQVEVQLGQADDDLKRYHHLFSQCQEDLKRYTHEQQRAQAYLAQHPVSDWQAEGEIIHREFARRQEATFSLDTLASAQDEMRRYFGNRANSFMGQRNTLQGGLLDRIASFRSEYRVETESIGVGIEALPDLETLLERIERDDLPRHRARFKEMLDKKVRDNIAGFQAELEGMTEKYREVIIQLNESLRRIPYEGEAVYIQLQAENNPDVDIRGFRAELRACLDDATANTPEALSAAYERIRQLIRQFEDPARDRWVRKVTDVRMWLNFAAAELWRDDDSQKRFHSDSSGMSGGQKAKLAYTILASAVAYQYGVFQAERPEQTFRFVVIDEAFSKVDDNNARYAMELFQQLGLQLLVITPMDKMHVVEPYVGAYHYVYNNEEGSHSQVLNLTVDAFRTLRAEAQPAAPLRSS